MTAGGSLPATAGSRGLQDPPEKSEPPTDPRHRATSKVPEGAVDNSVN